MTKTPMRQLKPIREKPYDPLRKRLMRAFCEWIADEFVYVDFKDPRFEGEPFLWSWNQEGAGSTLRIGRWRIELNCYIPGAPSDRDPVPAWAQR